MSVKIDTQARIAAVRFQNQTGSPAAPAVGYSLLYLTANGLYMETSGGAVIGPFVTGTAPSSGGLLGIVSYADGSDTATYQTSSSTMADLDATNVKVTFTAPASGNVLVILTALAQGGTHLFVQVREGTNNIGPVAIMEGGTNFPGAYSAHLYITGISAGSHTYKFAWKVDGSTATIYTGPSYGPVVMEVWSAP